MSYAFRTSPTDLKNALQAANELKSQAQVKKILERLDEAMLADLQLMKKGRPVAQTVVQLDNYSIPELQQAVSQLKAAGYQAKHTHEDECDDGPGRSSPARDFIVISHV